jgi:hypothetical protein
MKLSTAFNILSVTTLAIANASAANKAIRRGETGTRHLSSKKGDKKGGRTEHFDVRLQTGATYSLFEHGPIEVFVECSPQDAPDSVVLRAVVTNDSKDDALSLFGSIAEQGFLYTLLPEDDSHSHEMHVWPPVEWSDPVTPVEDEWSGPVTPVEDPVDPVDPGDDWSGTIGRGPLGLVVWRVDDEGIQDAPLGAVGTSTGYYVGIDGDTAIGLQRNDADALCAYGDNVNCVFMGSFRTSFDKPGEVILAE